MTLYHGSYIEIKQPRIIRRKYTKDFGSGFYCTEMIEQAKRWAKRYDAPCLNQYDYIKNDNLRILEFYDMTEEWLDFIVACRSGKKHSFDIVSGSMANDQIFNYISDFMNGILTREQFWVLAKFKHPTHQTVFCTGKALQCLTFIKSESI